MTPEDVAADIELLVPFYATVRDETPRSREEMDRGLDLLLGKDGVRLVAWFWPDPSFDTSFDPSAAGWLPDAEYRRVLSDNLRQFMVSAASAARVTLADVRTHVAWSAALSSRDMARLTEGYGHDLPLVVALCDSLHLDFDRQWVITDPQRLRRRIEQSQMAVEISLRLRDLTADNLAAVRRKLPKGAREGVAAPETYPAPRIGSRYRPLYEALAADTRESPTYPVTELDRILKEGGEPGLPKSASRDVSWWSGVGSRAEGRPQISAWWAAGFRIGRIVAGPEGEVLDVWFEALPGRSAWMCDPDRIDRAEYRLPGPLKIPIKLGTGGGDPLSLKDLPVPTDGAPPGEAQELGDPAVDELVELLTLEGEADRTMIAAHFEANRPSECSVEWLTRLLTRARRQGRTVNHGTRRHPRWVAAGSKGDLMLQIAAMLHFEWRHVGRGSEIPAEFFTRVSVRTGLNPPEGMTGEQIAQRIIRALGQQWREDDHGSIAFTSEALVKLRDALRALPKQVAE